MSKMPPVCEVGPIELNAFMILTLLISLFVHAVIVNRGILIMEE